MMWIHLLISFTSWKDVVLFIYQFHGFEAHVLYAISDAYLILVHI